MTSFKATKKSKDDSYLEIDLKKMFGTEVPDDSSLRQAIGQEILDTIVNRTEDAEFLNDAKGSYSPEYVHSPEFEAFGKSKNNVNLTQSGDMLGLLDIIEDNANEIKIGWNDSVNRAKGTNHNFGITLPKREFLGLTDKEVNKIKDKFKSEISAGQTNPLRSQAIDNLRKFILGDTSLDLSFEDETNQLVALINNQLKRFGP